MPQLGLLPVILVVLTFLTFVISYIIAVARGDVRAAFPYISDTGSERPESCIFGQFLNIAAWLALATMYFRYKAVQTIVGDINEDPWIRKLNKSALIVGIFSCIGCSVVANFQEGTMVEIVHFVGAITTFGLGIVYCFLQSSLSYQMYPCFNGLRICRVRLAISILSVISLVISLGAAVSAFHDWNKTHHTIRQKLRWSPGEPGYIAHVISAVGEWVTAIVFFMFFLTYVRELNKFELEVKAKHAVRYLEDSAEPLGEPHERTRLIL